MTLLVWTLVVPLVTAALGAIRAPRKVEEIVILAGLSVTFALCLATASQFLTGDVPSAFGGALRVDGLSALVLVLCGFIGLLSASYGIGLSRRSPTQRATGTLTAFPMSFHRAPARARDRHRGCACRAEEVGGCFSAVCNWG